MSYYRNTEQLSETQRNQQHNGRLIHWSSVIWGFGVLKSGFISTLFSTLFQSVVCRRQESNYHSVMPMLLRFHHMLMLRYHQIYHQHAGTGPARKWKPTHCIPPQKMGGVGFIVS